MTDPVLALLQDNNIPYTSAGKDYLIHCLNPHHTDSSPSCRVDKVTGVTHCFACGWKRNLFKHFGVFTFRASVRVQELKMKLRELRTSTEGLEYPEGHTPYATKLRGISRETLKHFEAFTTNSLEKLQDRVIFPIKDITGKIVVFVARHLLSDAVPRYVNYPSGVTMPLFPSKLETVSSNIVLVEGIFDMLNLYDKGVKNAVCCFGTSTLKQHTGRKLLAFKVQGVTKVFIAFDGDDAGRLAAEQLKPLIEAEGFIVEILTLPEGADPGDLDQANIDIMREYTK